MTKISKRLLIKSCKAAKKNKHFKYKAVISNHLQLEVEQLNTIAVDFWKYLDKRRQNKIEVSKSATIIHFGSKDKVKIRLMEHLEHWRTATKDWPPKFWTLLRPAAFRYSSSLLTLQCCDCWDASEEPSLLSGWSWGSTFIFCEICNYFHVNDSVLAMTGQLCWEDFGMRISWCHETCVHNNCTINTVISSV